MTGKAVKEDILEKISGGSEVYDPSEILGYKTRNMIKVWVRNAKFRKKSASQCKADAITKLSVLEACQKRYGDRYLRDNGEYITQEDLNRYIEQIWDEQ